MLALAAWGAPSWSDSQLEYRVKAGFIYNFATFTEWPEFVGPVLNLCIYGDDPFGSSLDDLEGKNVGMRSLNIRRVDLAQDLEGCHIVFFARATAEMLPGLLPSLRGKPVLTVADSPGAVHHGVALNMFVKQNRIVFAANQAAARDNGLVLSAKLLRLATEVVR